MVFGSRFMPCAECGASIDRTDLAVHVCSAARRADYQLFGMRDDVARLETDVRRWLLTAAGRFESWLAAQQVRGEA